MTSVEPNTIILSKPRAWTQSKSSSITSIARQSLISTEIIRNQAYGSHKIIDLNQPGSSTIILATISGNIPISVPITGVEDRDMKFKISYIIGYNEHNYRIVNQIQNTIILTTKDLEILTNDLKSII